VQSIPLAAHGMSDTGPVDPRTDEELTAIVEGFVLRVRRIESHSIVQDREGWIDYLANGTLVVESEGGRVTLSQSPPKEESLESLAGRVRPLVLQQDPVQYGFVLNALSALLVRADYREGVRWCKELRKDWKTLDPLEGAVTSYHSFISDDPELSRTLTDRELALSWFYGDYVHADVDRRRSAEAWSINDRFRAAVTYVAQLAVLARDTRAFMIALCDAGVIDLAEDAMSGIAVTVTPQTGHEAQLYFGETPGLLPDPVGAIPEDWQQISAASFDGDTSLDLTIPWGRTDKYLDSPEPGPAPRERQEPTEPPPRWCWSCQLAAATRSRQARTSATS
jgi:hypothetical protein